MKHKKVTLQEPAKSTRTKTLHPNWKLRCSTHLIQSESDNSSIYIAEGDTHAEALVLGGPNSYSQEYSFTSNDPSGTYLTSSLGIWKKLEVPPQYRRFVLDLRGIRLRQDSRWRTRESALPVPDGLAVRPP